VGPSHDPVIAGHDVEVITERRAMKRA